jgi:hypothetical protein
MELDKTEQVEKDLERLGFAPLIREMRQKIQGKDQLLLAYRDPGHVQKKMPMLCIVDIRLHGMKDEYYIHNYSATITKENKDRLSEKYITRSRTFYLKKGEIPAIQEARQLVEKDISRKLEQKKVKRKEKYNKKGLR